MVVNKKAIDPVCGMTINVNSSTLKSSYKCKESVREERLNYTRFCISINGIFITQNRLDVFIPAVF